MKKIGLSMICVVCILASMFAFTIKEVSAAATIAIQNVPSSVRPQTTFQVSVSIPGYLGGTVTLYGNNCTIISQNPVMIDGSASFTVQAGNAGSASISASTSDATNPNDFSITNGSGYAAFSIVQPSNNTPNTTPPKPTQGGSTTNNSNSSNNTTTNTPQDRETPSTTDEETKTLSSNTNLSSLTISQGELSPSFQNDVTSYDVVLDDTQKELRIQATAEDDKAQLIYNEVTSLKLGKNEIEVLVRGEDGSEKNYILHVSVKEKQPVYISYKGTKLSLLSSIQDVVAPKNFEKTQFTIQGRTIDGWKHKDQSIYLLYALHPKTKQYSYYMYDKKTTSITSIIVPVHIQGTEYFALELEATNKEIMRKDQVRIEDTILPAYTYQDGRFKNYVVVHLMDEEGNTQYYQYETTQKTLQLWNHAVVLHKDSYLSMQDKQRRSTIVNYVFGGMLVITMVGAGCYIYKFKKN